MMLVRSGCGLWRADGRAEFNLDHASHDDLTAATSTATTRAAVTVTLTASTTTTSRAEEEEKVANWFLSVADIRESGKKPKSTKPRSNRTSLH